MELREGLQEGYVEIGLGRIRYVKAGSGSPLFLIHGGFGGWEHWYENILPLSAQHTVIAPDLPGFGLSCNVAPDVSIDVYVSHVWDAIAAIRATLPDPVKHARIGLVGFSFGTAVSTVLALNHSTNVRGVLLVNPPGLGQVTQEARDVQARVNITAKEAGLRAGIEITLKELMLCQKDRATRFAGDLIEQCVRKGRFASRSLSRATPVIDLLPQLKAPVHILVGAHDPHQKSQLAQRVARVSDILGPQGVTVYADTAHWLQYERPARFNAQALDWFARLEKEAMPVPTTV
jgi:2-hydroxy-6-oxonona-2,4-dienedioate hydrolase